tara:strand:- start:670 stop:1419 length:750 start_codon:yes stop_codon:yes gene_type:complete
MATEAQVPYLLTLSTTLSDRPDNHAMIRSGGGRRSEVVAQLPPPAYRNRYPTKEPCVTKHTMLLSLFVVLASSIPFAGRTQADDSSADSRSNATQYLVELSEYKLEQSIPTGLSEDQVIDAMLKAGTKPVETIRLTAVSDTESVAKIGRRVALAPGTITQNGVMSRQVKDVEIGTMLSITIKHHVKGAIADIAYTTSRFDGDGTDGSSPDVLTNTTQSSQVYSIGKPRLLSTVGVGELTGVLVIVREIP